MKELSSTQHDFPVGITEEMFRNICKIPIFENLSADSVRYLIKNSTIQKFSPDTLVFSEGDPADAFFITISGSVQLFALSEDGGESIIEIVGDFTSFAEAAMFASARYPVNCETLEETRILKVHRSDFISQLELHPRLALQIVASLERWQHRLTGELWQRKAQTPAQRLAWLLVTLSDGAEGATEVTLPHAKGTIAARIGIAPESLSRAFVRLADLGVETQGSRVKIADVARLREYCGH